MIRAAQRIEAATVARSGFSGRAGMIDAMVSLRSALEVEHLALAAWDPVTRAHRTVVDAGYPPGVAARTARLMHHDRAFALARSVRRPLRLAEVPPEYADGPIMRSVVGPQGFADGMTHCLFDGDGRYVGMLNASTSGGAIDDIAVSLVASIQGDLSKALARSRDARPRPSGTIVVRGNEAGAAGTEMPAAVLGAQSWLAAVREDAREVADGRVPAASVLVVSERTVLAVTLARVAGAVEATPRRVASPCGLSIRELEVAALVATGASNSEIADRLGITGATVRTHVERLLHKTDSRSRAGVAAWAAVRRLRVVP